MWEVDVGGSTSLAEARAAITSREKITLILFRLSVHEEQISESQKERHHGSEYDKKFNVRLGVYCESVRCCAVVGYVVFGPRGLWGW
jgi:hypothetical protein